MVGDTIVTAAFTVKVLDEVEESPCTAVTVTVYACPGALAETKNLEALFGPFLLSCPVVSMKQIGDESVPISWLGVDDNVHGPASSGENPPPPPLKKTGVPVGPVVVGPIEMAAGAGSIVKLVVGVFDAESVTVIVTGPVPSGTGFATVKLAVKVPEESTVQVDAANNPVGCA
jgi:hypothetical protein